MWYVCLYVDLSLSVYMYLCWVVTCEDEETLSIDLLEPLEVWEELQESNRSYRSYRWEEKWGKNGFKILLHGFVSSRVVYVKCLKTWECPMCNGLCVHCKWHPLLPHCWRSWNSHMRWIEVCEERSYSMSVAVGLCFFISESVWTGSELENVIDVYFVANASMHCWRWWCWRSWRGHRWIAVWGGILLRVCSFKDFDVKFLNLRECPLSNCFVSMHSWRW